MRRVLILDRAFPPSEADLATAESLGATEVLCGVPAALPGLSFGYHELADPPTEDARRLIPKSVVQDRLIEAGKLTAVLNILRMDDASYVRWFAPNHPNVYADDPSMLTVLTMVDADIEAITAPEA